MKVFFDSSYPRDHMGCVLVWKGKVLLPAGHCWKEFLQNAYGALNLKASQGMLVMISEKESCILWNMGEEDVFACAEETRRLGGRLWKWLSLYAPEKTALFAESLEKDAVVNIAYGALLRSGRFEKYHTSFRPLPVVGCSTFTCVTPHAEACEGAWAQDAWVIDSVHWTRELINEPGNVLYPASFVQRLQELSHYGVTVEVLDKKVLEKEKFGALLGVAQGSTHDPYLVVLHWNGGGAHKDSQPVALVGKGVTFDSGGLSLKPASSMEDMKMDMAGAAVVAGVIRALAMTKAPVHAVAVVALVENMASGSAQRPGDIVTSLSGQTIEVLNTDAEGRLILADALFYTQKRFSPAHMVDVATLTGAITVALGSTYAGLFSSSPALAEDLRAMGETVGEPLWHMPLHKSYDEALNSDHADMKNITSPGVGAGSNTAAQFLKRFVSMESWAHLDIAGMDFLKRSTDLSEKGGNAFGVRLLYQWVRKCFEKKVA